VRPTLAGEQDGQGDAHKNGTPENEERATVLHTVNAAAGASEDGQENFRQDPQSNHYLDDIIERQGYLSTMSV
jgi:hypothetical protein